MNHILSVRDKSVPARFWGRDASEVAAERPPVSDFATPLLVLDAAAEAHNVGLLAGWARERGLELAPHGKTTMSPTLWRHLIDAGSGTLTFATPWQVQVARSEGFSRVILANELVDPVAIDWVAAELDADAAFEFACWIDSAEGLAALAGSTGERPIDVLVELGGPGGRTGVRRTDPALALAWAASTEPRVRLVGVAGYEGAFGGDRSSGSTTAVHDYLGGLVALYDAIAEFGLFEIEQPIITAGGSAWFDLVADAFAPLAGRARRILRSGAFQAHDDVFYAGISPFGEAATPDADAAARFRPALTVHSRVLSRPEPRLAVLDAGRRDVPYDLDLPVARNVDGSPIADARVIKLNDQHTYLELPAASPLRVGDVVRLGVSHPCTAFDKWRVVPVIDDAAVEAPVVVDFAETLF